MVGLLATLMLTAKTCYGAENMKATRELTFVRHGQTDWSMDLVLQGPSNPSLNEVGRETIKRSASYLKTLGPKEWVMWSSPLIRTQETAQIIINQGVTVVQHLVKDKIQERYFGDFRLHPKTPPDRETDEAFNERIGGLIKEIEQGPANLIVVGHGKMFEKMCELMGVTPKAKIDFGDVFHFTHTQGVWSIVGPVDLR